jgi:hypothetical protein
MKSFFVYSLFTLIACSSSAAELQGVYTGSGSGFYSNFAMNCTGTLEFSINGKFFKIGGERSTFRCKFPDAPNHATPAYSFEGTEYHIGPREDESGLFTSLYDTKSKIVGEYRGDTLTLSDKCGSGLAVCNVNVMVKSNGDILVSHMVTKSTPYSLMLEMKKVK